MATSRDNEKALDDLLMAQATALDATIQAILAELHDAASAGGGRGPGVPPRRVATLDAAKEVSGKIGELIHALHGGTAAGGGRGANARPT